MTLRDSYKVAIENTVEWYIRTVENLVDRMEEGGIPIFTAPQSEEDRWAMFSSRTDADWKRRIAEAGVEQANAEYAQYLKMAEKR